jgi:hypothetical protein
MHWKPVDSIPPKCAKSGKLRDSEAWIRPTKKLTARTYSNLIRAFRDSDAQHARCIFDADRHDARMLLSGFNSAIRQGRWRGMRIVTRGDALYITRDPAPERITANDIVPTLRAFDASDKHTDTIDTIGMDESAIAYLCAAIQRHRTRAGLGNIRVSRRDGGITLTNTMIDPPKR